MKAGAVFINTARESIHDEDALADALTSGHLAGAGLDVWEVEPPQPDHRLMQMQNVIATPHVAGCTSDSLQNMAAHAATKLLDFFWKAGSTARRPRCAPKVSSALCADFGRAFTEMTVSGKFQVSCFQTGKVYAVF